jgi:hypothetical protein
MSSASGRVLASSLLAVTLTLALAPAMGHELSTGLVVDHAALPLGRGDLIEDRLLEALRLVGVDSLLGEVL